MANNILHAMRCRASVRITLAMKEMNSKAKAGRAIIIGVCAFFAGLIVINLIRSRFLGANDRPAIQIIRLAVLPCLGAFLYRGHSWARVTLGVFGCVAAVVSIGGWIFLPEFIPLPDLHQIALLAGWFVMPVLMFAPFGVKEFQQLQTPDRIGQQPDAEVQSEGAPSD